MTRRMGVDMPSTLQRPPGKAQRTYEMTLRPAQQEFGKGERATRHGRAAPG